MRSVYDNTLVRGYAVARNTLAAVTVTGESVDTKGFNSAALRLYTSKLGAGIAVGAGCSLTAVLEESADDVTYAAALDNGGTQIQVTNNATTVAVFGSARIEGLGLSNRLRYLRVKTTPQMVGTSSVYIFTSVAVIELGRAYTLPTVTGTSNT